MSLCNVKGQLLIEHMEGPPPVPLMADGGGRKISVWDIILGTLGRSEIAHMWENTKRASENWLDNV